MTKVDSILKKVKLFEKVAVSNSLKQAMPSDRSVEFLNYADLAKRTIINVLPEFTSVDFTTPQNAINAINKALNEYNSVFTDQQLKYLHYAKKSILNMMSKLQRNQDYSKFANLAKRTVINVLPEFTNADISTPQKALAFIDKILNEYSHVFDDKSLQNLNFAKVNVKNFV